ncbi:hypothetical protein Aduo_015448 [Ancylostoma duodenale]
MRGRRLANAARAQGAYSKRNYRLFKLDQKPSHVVPVPTEPHPVAYHSAGSQQISPAATCHPVAAIVPSSDNLHKLKERKLTRFIVV